MGGKIAARFKLDKDGKPRYLISGGLKNYLIDLYVESASPDLGSVTYKLDNSYYDPIRESDNRDNSFMEEITSYGDYPVLVEAQLGRRLVAEKINLSSLLEEGHKGAQDKPEILAAINDIKSL
jgi:hypothetical protein